MIVRENLSLRYVSLECPEEGVTSYHNFIVEVNELANANRFQLLSVDMNP